MNIVLLKLSGDSSAAIKKLQAQYPDATIQGVGRDQIEKLNSLQRVSFFRAMQPDILAVSTERLVWQRGQNAFVLLGALAGARRTIIFDAHGGQHEESRARALVNAPPRLAREAATSVAAMKCAEKELKRLEEAVAAGTNSDMHARASVNPIIVYLRSSPGPGTQAGGAASHINGFIKAATELGAHVSLISNDKIAGLDTTEVSRKIIWPTPVGSSRAAFDIYNNLLFTDAIVAEVEKTEPDFIYQRYARFSWAGVAASLRTNRPLFLEYNGSGGWGGRYLGPVKKPEFFARD